MSGPTYSMYQIGNMKTSITPKEYFTATFNQYENNYAQNY